jgi:hypothetical protein
MAIKTSSNDIVFIIGIFIVVAVLGAITESISDLARYLDTSTGVNALTYQIIIYCFLVFIILYYLYKKYWKV